MSQCLFAIFGMCLWYATSPAQTTSIHIPLSVRFLHAKAEDTTLEVNWIPKWSTYQVTFPLLDRQGNLSYIPEDQRYYSSPIEGKMTVSFRTTSTQGSETVMGRIFKTNYVSPSFDGVVSLSPCDRTTSVIKAGEQYWINCESRNCCVVLYVIGTVPIPEEDQC